MTAGLIRRVDVPTGSICIKPGEKGKLLEFLSIGDYGKERNIKADFLGLTREIEGVPHGQMMPLEEKWVVTISTQYGCSMGCKFCDVPRVGPGLNATLRDLNDQITSAIAIHPEVKQTKRLNVHFARMGEPTFNPDVLHCALGLPELIKPFLGDSLVHPVVSTMMPKSLPYTRLKTFLGEWLDIKNDVYDGNAGLQLSINSTSEWQRAGMFGGNVNDWASGNARDLLDISNIMEELLATRPLKGRKIALNFALAGYEIDAKYLAVMFPPEQFMCKITPMHVTNACQANGIMTEDGYTSFAPYREVEEQLKAAGFDVIVFVPSLEEDRGRITCGNAILTTPTWEWR